MTFLSCLDSVACLFNWRQKSDNSYIVCRIRNLTKTVLAVLSCHAGGHRALKKYILAMKLTFILITIGFLHVTAASVSQTVTVAAKDFRIDSIFAIVKKQTGFVFFCSKEIINDVGPITIHAHQMELNQFLHTLFSQLPLKYTTRNKTIIVSRKPGQSLEYDRSPANELQEVVLTAPIKGVVRGRDGKPLTGATVLVKGTNIGTSTDASGRFEIEVKLNQTIIISFIGYEAQEKKITSLEAAAIDITLIPEEQHIGEVIINTGIIKKDKTSFTGAVAVYSGAELKVVGNKNILESLRTLDPSFLKVENNLRGSDPNNIGNFEIRGQTSISTEALNDQFNQDPNQPLFILDGFPTTLQIINDLDMNRVESVTILRDAASTALYGSKAANGVIVVATKRSTPGKLRISYNTDIALQIPDFSSYNLMNAEEKLQHDILHNGLYYGAGTKDWEGVALNNERLLEIRRGVNTYWLSEPVQIDLRNRHSLQLSGGSQELMFNGAVSLEKQNGIMKGSSRNVWSGSMGVSYNKGNLIINNQLNATGTRANESPFGSFSEFSNAIPYFRKTISDGTIEKFLYAPWQPNPLYNASLFSIHETKLFTFSNNLDLAYLLSNRFRIQGGLQLIRDNNLKVVFVSPEHTSFVTSDPSRKGSYNEDNGAGFGYNANLMLQYGENVGKSQISAAVRGDLVENNSRTRGFSALGFPYGSDGNPVYAFGYTPFGGPLASDNRGRSVGLLLNFNYAWDKRFVVDATYRLDGTTAFGSEKTFKPFVSGGVGWNMHEETALKQSNVIDLLKIRANAGYTGNENLGSFTSVSTYTFMSGLDNAFGQGIIVNSLGNPTLDWQKTLQWSYGIDFALWKNRVSGSVEYYKKITDPLAISTSGILPSSTGAGNNYVINVGALTTTGWTVNVRLQPIYIPAQRIIWNISLTGSNNKSVYSGLGDRLAKLNEKQIEGKGLLRFADGFSPTDLWAVISRGIDPATGNEIFQKADGSLTFDYRTDDIVRIGDARPLGEGVINSSFTYKAFSVGGALRYRIGGRVFNNALYSKVENLNQRQQNFDKRALYDRWQKPGDIAQFTRITSTVANLSSRFIQTDNHLIGESIHLSWRSYADWLKRLNIQNLSISVYANDIFRLEKIISERGLDYPYARSVNLSLNVSF